jgi:hypothetical protein
MPKESMAQKKSIERVMHKYKHNELQSGKKGDGGKVKSRKQAVAIALSEAGASNRVRKGTNKKNLSNTKSKEATGITAKQRKDGHL